MKNADTLAEAVAQFYENPNKYSNNSGPSTSDTSNNPYAAAVNAKGTKEAKTQVQQHDPPPYAPPQISAPRRRHHNHTNAVIQAGNVRARDEQDMQNLLQSVQLAYRIYNSDIEPEHESDYYCNCAIHQYKRRKMNRLGVQEMWSKAVMYPGQHTS